MTWLEFERKVGEMTSRLTSDLTDLMAQIDKAKALALTCQDTTERMRYAQIKCALELDLARAIGIVNEGEAK